MTYEDNPAGHLHKFLVSLRGGKKDQLTYQCIADALDVEKSSAELMVGIVSLRRLLDRTSGLMREQQENPTPFINRIESHVGRLLSLPGLQMKLEHHLVGAMGDGAMTQLAVCSELLRGQENPVAEEHFQKVMQSAQDTLAEVNTLPIDPAAKTELLRHTETLIFTLEKYHYFGVAAVTDSASALAGSWQFAELKRDLQAEEDLKESPSYTKARESIRSTIHDAAVLVTLVTAGVEHLPKVKALIEGIGRSLGP